MLYAFLLYINVTFQTYYNITNETEWSLHTISTRQLSVQATRWHLTWTPVTMNHQNNAYTCTLSDVGSESIQYIKLCFRICVMWCHLWLMHETNVIPVQVNRHIFGLSFFLWCKQKKTDYRYQFTWYTTETQEYSYWKRLEFFAIKKHLKLVILMNQTWTFTYSASFKILPLLQMLGFCGVLHYLHIHTQRQNTQKRKRKKFKFYIISGTPRVCDTMCTNLQDIEEIMQRAQKSYVSLLVLS
jgi:hypothetical protein